MGFLIRLGLSNDDIINLTPEDVHVLADIAGLSTTIIRKENTCVRCDRPTGDTTSKHCPMCEVTGRATL